MHSDFIETPIGTLFIKASDKGITHLIFSGDKHAISSNCAIIDKCKQQLNEYFLGKRKTFDVPLDQNGTEFQRHVWNQLIKIPYGKAISYHDLAVDIGKPKAVRAVGAANGRNPISIIVPCHRVIGKSQKLTGYAGGLERKAWLLNHENITFKQ